MKNKLYLLIALLLGFFAIGTTAMAVTFDETKEYTIKNADCGLYLSVQAADSYTESSSDNATPLVADPTYFTIKASGTKFSLKSGNLYIALSTKMGWNTKSQTSASSIWTIAETETPGQFTIQSTKGYLKYDGKNKFAYTDGKAGDKIYWVIEERIPFATELSEGQVYRFKNCLYPEYLLTENHADNNLYGNTAANVRTPYAQLWRASKTSDLNGTEGKWKLTNILTGRSIAAQNTTSAQFKTTTSGTSFVVQKGTANGQTYFSFGLAKDGAGLHCDAAKKIVNWNVSADASHWYLQPAELSEEQLAEAAAFYKEYTDAKTAVSNINTKRSTYNTALATFFTDLSCSELLPEFQKLSDDELRYAMEASELPEALQQHAVCVKNGIWEADKDETYNSYVRQFRIGEYEPYSDRQTWRKIVNVGPFGELVNPTGVTVKAGEIVYIYLDQAAKDSYASIQLELAKGTEHTGVTTKLNKGINAWQATEDGELFIYYFVNNEKKYVVATKDHEADYPNIHVHIEGGHATGTWDMHRGMDNDDWDYLSKNMFGAEYLHVKGESTVLSLVTSKVKGAPNVEGIIKIWDFIFDTEERLVGHDGQWDGRYRPVITPRDCNTSMNPNWGGNCGTNHPSISKDYLFNFEKMVNDIGHIWEIYHEEGHAHQYPINMAATTESSNNGYAQMTNYEFGNYNSRNKGIETLITFKNNGWGWVDILRGGEGTSRTEGFEYYDQALWLQCHMFYQLYLYFHVQGYDTDFWPRVADKMRENGGIKLHGNDPNNPTLYYEDYLKFAEACADVSETDLFDFFDSWGFFAYYDDVKVGNDFTKGTAFKEKDNPSKGIRFVGDYGSYYLKMPVRGVKADEDRLLKLRQKMQGFEKKAPGIMFIDDHIKAMKVTDTCFVATIYPTRVGKEQGYYGVTKGTSGDVGMFWDFDGKTSADNIYYTLSGSNVTINGSGYVGIKIYDTTATDISPIGRVVRIYNKKKFTLDSEALKNVNSGKWVLYAPCGDNTQVFVGKDAPAAGIDTVLAPIGTPDIYDLNGRRVNNAHNGLYIQGGRKVIR